MARRRPRHGQNAPARAYAGIALTSLAVLITGGMFLQAYGVTPLKFAVATAAVIAIISWQVWRQKRRARLGGAERPPADSPGYKSAEPPSTEDT
jgi:hypothetical protein